MAVVLLECSDADFELELGGFAGLAEPHFHLLVGEDEE